jgi:DNA-binding NtrC family response regulator
MTPNAVVCMSDARLRGLFSIMLADIGAAVSSCADADEARRVLASRFCHVCVFAFGTEEEQADFVCRARQDTPETRLLLVANREAVDGVLPLFSRGLDEALLQPINPKRAMVAVRALLGQITPKVAVGQSAAPFALEVEHRPMHLTARSAAMRRALNALWVSRNDPLGVMLRGEVGVEFELAAREFHAMGGETHGSLVVLEAKELDVDTLATQLSLDRLSEGLPRTYFLADVDKVAKAQERPLLDFLRKARRQREREKPLRIVCSALEQKGATQTTEGDGEFLEELQFLMPAVVRLPSLAERREDIGRIAQRVLAAITEIHPELRVRAFHPAASQWLEARQWPGNYRELANAIVQAARECPNRDLTAGHFGKLCEAPRDLEEEAAGRVLAAAQKTFEK